MISQVAYLRPVPRKGRLRPANHDGALPALDSGKEMLEQEQV